MPGLNRNVRECLYTAFFVDLVDHLIEFVFGFRTFKQAVVVVIFLSVTGDVTVYKLYSCPA